MATSRNTKKPTVAKRKLTPGKLLAEGKAKTTLTGVTEADTVDVLAPQAEPVLEAAKEEKVQPPVFKMQELMQALSIKSELKRSELRETVGHVLEALGKALADGNDVALPGLGKINAKRREMKPGGEQIIARIKLLDPANVPTKLEVQDDD